MKSVSLRLGLSSVFLFFFFLSTFQSYSFSNSSIPDVMSSGTLRYNRFPLTSSRSAEDFSILPLENKIFSFSNPLLSESSLSLGNDYKEDEKILKTKEQIETGLLVKYKKNKVDLKSSDQKLENQFLETNNLVKKNEIKDLNLSFVSVNDGLTLEQKFKELKENPNVEYVEVNMQLSPLDLPNDPLFNSQWSLYNTSQIVNGTSGLSDADIDAPEAWEISSRNNNSVIVAVIDSGVAYNHPDLRNNMWDGTNCVNPEGRYLGGCLHGYDFIYDDKDPYPNSGDSHGTHVAGIIAATKDNNIGIAGVNNNVKIMALKSDFSTFQLIDAIFFAMQNGAKIINLSAGGPVFSQSTYDAIRVFQESGGLFIVAAGNDGSNNDSTPMYPASYNLENIISVANTDQRDVLYPYSNYGLSSVDIAAPGSNILSTFTTNKTIFLENFENVLVPNFPIGWDKTGKWNTIFKDDSYNDIVALSDDMFPYTNNSNSILGSPLLDLSIYESVSLDFKATCDTEYPIYGSSMYDYLKVVAMDQDTLLYQELDLGYGSGRFDERTLDILNSENPLNSSGFSTYEFKDIALPRNYLSKNFRLGFIWITDSFGSYYGGCFIDNVKLNIIDSSSIENYEVKGGTSMSAPVVTGVVSLVWGYRPQLNATIVKNVVMSTGDVKQSLIGKVASGSRVNAYNALLAVQGEVIDTFYFNIDGVKYSCTINEKNKTINCPLPSDIIKSNLTPTITLTGGSISPESGVALDFSGVANTYTYTQSGGIVEIYTVNISNYFRTLAPFRSGVGNWGVSNTKYTVSGDYNGDGRDEIAAMYDYGREDMAIFLFVPSLNGEAFSTARWFKSGVGNWGVSNTKFLTSGDYNGDGKDEIAAMYDYGNEDMAIFLFVPNGSSFTASLWFRSGRGNWGVPFTRFLTSGDFSGDGRDEIAAMYDYGSEDMAIFNFMSSGSSFQTELWFRSGRGNWGVPFTRFLTSGDYNGDGVDEVSAMYDYGNEDMAIFNFMSDPINKSFATSLWFRSGRGNWGVPFTRYLTTGDFNGDMKDEIAAMYDYGNEDMAFFLFVPNRSAFNTSLWFRSGKGNWGVPFTKHVSSGDYNGNGIDEVSAMYDYGREDMSVFLFK